jgi:serine/threonine protein kinase
MSPEGRPDVTVEQLAPGATLGPYRIDALLGAGGMGQVYRATDSRLGRTVAIKISREQFSARFEREARAIAALNHPHICTLYDVGPNYLVMELVEGETLAARLHKGRLALPDVLRYGAQIAEALAAAHARGIVHRDLKPGNIMLTKSGVKILDFGLAKIASSTEGTLRLSRVVMGTPAYMAPEQLEGRECDARTDIFALGLILSEMATGQRGSVSGLPPNISHAVEQCLERDPENRWQSASDVKAELEWTAKTPLPTAPSKQVPFWIWALAAALSVLGFLVGIWFMHSRQGPQPSPAMTRLALNPPETLHSPKWRFRPMDAGWRLQQPDPTARGSFGYAL